MDSEGTFSDVSMGLHVGAGLHVDAQAMQPLAVVLAEAVRGEDSRSALCAPTGTNSGPVESNPI